MISEDYYIPTKDHNEKTGPKIYVTSDTHFNHVKILEYCHRPWATVPEMNDGLIENWNSVVSQEDTVYHIGDFAMGDRRQIPDILSRLNGKIVLIRGNHDQGSSLKYFPEVHTHLILEIDGKKVEMAHSPGDLKFGCWMSLCGHVHELWKYKKYGDVIAADVIHDHGVKHPDILAKGDIYNVGVDVNDYKPVLLTDICEFLGVKYIQKKLFESIKIPKAFLEYDKERGL